jgi:hypothetical protein
MAAWGMGATPIGAQQPAAGESAVGILVMAHGGAPEWDRAVVEAVEPVKALVPTALALGMADPHTMQAALDSLQNLGVGKVAVVRLFLSGESFLHDTEFYLGLRPDAPAMPMAMMMSHGPGQSHAMGPIAPLRRTADIFLETRGLSEVPQTAAIVADRARAVSADPSRESVIVIAHGMGDEGENRRVLDNMQLSVEALRGLGFREVTAMTLREDWPEARQQAEKDIQAWVASRTERGDRVIAVPYRLFGFGGYAEVLQGLSYTAADGLLPHERISNWILDSAKSLFCAKGISSAVGSCGTSTR